MFDYLGTIGINVSAKFWKVLSFSFFCLFLVGFFRFLTGYSIFLSMYMVYDKET